MLMQFRKLSIALCILALLNIKANSQTLFTYGTKAVNKDEFLKAFNKNPDTTGDRNEKIKQYLDLYVNFKLKLQAAADEKLNGSPEFKAEAENFRAQLTENYINEQANINGLVTEAFQRSQKDILISQVFVGYPKGGDTTEAYNRIRQAYNSLQNGQNFSEVTKSFSTDESVVKAEGVIGYITVFTLPYEVENMVYGLNPGQYSNIYKSAFGYHIFKNEKERPALGKRKIQQILIPTPESFTADERSAAAKLADSVYGLLQGGAPFDKIADVYSAPNNNYDESNTVEVAVGQYNSDFESQVFDLKKPGDFSRPFQTYYGYNIIKLVEEKLVSHDETDVVARASIQEMIERDNRLGIARNALIDKWMKQAKYTKAVYDQKNLWAYTDSSLKKEKALAAYKGITPQTTLFSFAKQKMTAANWVQYNIESRQPGTEAPVDYTKEMTNFTRQSCDKYYRSHIEDFYPPIASQVKEFNEANLLFAVMDKHVWSKAAEDSAGLKKYYDEHQQQYTWQPGVSALIVSSESKTLLDSVAIELRKNNANWRNIISGFDNKVLADSSRFENGQLPVKMELPMQKGYVSQPEQNEAGDAYNMISIFDVYSQTAQRSFDDARGMVINDYQQVLEQKWIEALKKKYPVKINQAVVKTL